MQHINVNQSRVGLTGRYFGLLETGLFSHQLIEFLDCGVVALENGQEAGLRARSSLDPTEGSQKLLTLMLEGAQIAEQVGHPQARTLANRDQLSGLTVGVTQTWKVLVLDRKRRQALYDCGELREDDVQGVAQEDEVGIVSDVADGISAIGSKVHSSIVFITRQTHHEVAPQ